MLFRETVAVYWENHTEHTDTLCGDNPEFQHANKVDDVCSNHWGFKLINSVLYFHEGKG
jgi:hypothetical protein